MDFKINNIIINLLFIFLKDKFKILSIDDKNIQIFAIKIYNILENFNDDNLLYKNLVYMNLNSYIGNFFLIYQFNLIDACCKNDFIKLTNILFNCNSPEIDSNSNLNSLELKEILNLIEIDKLAINLYIYKKILQNSSLVFDIDLYNNCVLESYKYYCHENNICALNNFNKNIYVFIPESINILRSFYLPNVIYYIIKDKINPYTNSKFSIGVKNFVKNTYNTEYKLIEKYILESNNY